MSLPRDIGKPDGEAERRLDQKVLLMFSKEYADAYMEMPETSIGFFNLMERRILEDSFGNQFSKSVFELIKFLGNFFSGYLLKEINVSLEELASSGLTLAYTFQHTHGTIGQTILGDVIFDEFFHDVPAIPESQRGSPLKKHQKVGEGEGADSYEGADEVPEEKKELTDDTSAVFKELPMILVKFPLFLTFDEVSPNEFIEPQILSDCSKTFAADRVFLGLPIYHPSIQSTVITLFHGCKLSSMESFQADGINPLYRANEFSSDTAFYLGTSVRQCYEHSLHVHLARNRLERVLIYQFEMETKVLHGEKEPCAGSLPFKVKLFDCVGTEWKSFYHTNIFYHALFDKHDYDIVIGPICIPDMNGQFVKKLELKDGSSILIQVAFCSKRAIQWVNGCVTCSYIEERLQPLQPHTTATLKREY